MIDHQWWHNGEIMNTFDELRKKGFITDETINGSVKYTVWDETQAYEIGSTYYPLVAVAMLESYSSNYLEG